MSRVDLLGYVASASVLLTFCMTTMLPLRIVAICSNVLFATFGALAHIYPVLVLHVALLPVNVARLVQVLRLFRNITTAPPPEMPIEDFLSSMARRSVKAGQVLIAKGEPADRLYYLASGTMKIPELGRIVQPGAILGEIGVFAREKIRTATVVSVDDCEVYEMSESKARQLYLENQSFGLAVLQLVITRLTEEMLLQKTEANGHHAEEAPLCELASMKKSNLVNREAISA